MKKCDVNNSPKLSTKLNNMYLLNSIMEIAEANMSQPYN